ncbi:MAG: DUF3343 domain-containing protein [Candidatus Ornithospirochaeta sp.]
MDHNDKEVSFVATFRSHYGAMVFKKRFGEGCVLKPVPRTLSSSCGTAAFFSHEGWKDILDENVEAVWELTDGGWRKLYGEE